MAPQGMGQPFQQTPPGNLSRPAVQHLPAQRGQPHPLGEALTIDLTPQHPEPDQPDEGILQLIR